MSEEHMASMKYWISHCGSMLQRLLRASNSYSETDEEIQCRFFRDHVVPHLGPRPSPVKPLCMPMQPSINFTSRQKPKVRYAAQLCRTTPTTDPTTSLDPFGHLAARQIFAEIVASLGVCDGTTCLDAMSSALAVTESEEVASLQASLTRSSPQASTSVPRIPPLIFVAFDTDGAETFLKVYFSIRAKEIATGRPGVDLACDALRTHGGSGRAAYPIDVVKQYVPQNA